MKLVVWDFDGTLADTRLLIEDGMRFALKAMGKPSELMDKWLACVGLPVEEGLRRTFDVRNDSEMDSILNLYRSYDWVGNTHLIQPFPGMQELVAELNAKGVKQAIATSKRFKALEPQLADFGWADSFFPVITPERVTYPKPHPESLEVCLNTHNLHSEDAMMVGDTLFDLNMANAAKVPCIGVTYGFADESQLANAAPIACVGNVVELRKILLKFLKQDDHGSNTTF
ncbi:MAG: HAD family hydrolase [Holophagales bacterium]|nr:HAD family hydrolase [Holophagales bacterium]